MTQFALVVGILFADLVGFVLANERGWRWMFAMTSLMALLQLLLTPFLLESPRWLLSKNPNSSKARFIIKKLRGFRYDEEVETEVEHFVSTFDRAFICVESLLLHEAHASSMHSFVSLVYSWVLPRHNLSTTKLTIARRRRM